MDYLIANIGRDETVTLASQVGGQQYLDYSTGKLATPMGLARYVLQARQ
jgi:hypothetical protein